MLKYFYPLVENPYRKKDLDDLTEHLFNYYVKIRAKYIDSLYTYAKIKEDIIDKVFLLI